MYLDLHNIIGQECAKDSLYCSVNYIEWEKEVAEPLLNAIGWRVLRWFTLEGDSFGPLVRGVACSKNGERKTFFYG